jgi:hypothetical protein
MAHLTAHDGEDEGKRIESKYHVEPDPGQINTGWCNSYEVVME